MIDTDFTTKVTMSWKCLVQILMVFRLLFFIIIKAQTGVMLIRKFIPIVNTK